MVRAPNMKGAGCKKKRVSDDARAKTAELCGKRGKDGGGK
jgi:hypothetical protein